MTIANWNEETVQVVRERPRDPAAVIFRAGAEEMMRIQRDGFYVRGVKVPVGPEEARRVHMTFLKWLRSQGMAI